MDFNVLISLSKFNPPPYRFFLRDPCRPGLTEPLRITDILFDHTMTWRASPDEWSARCQSHLRDSTNMKDNTHQAYTHSYQQGEYGMMITAAK